MTDQVEEDVEINLPVMPDPLQLLTFPDVLKTFQERIKQQIQEHVPDTATAKGRQAIKSLAFSITRKKTEIDAAGVKLTEEWRKKTAQVNEQRAIVKTEFDALARLARKPLTDWEKAEDDRVAFVAGIKRQIKQAKIVTHSDTSEGVAARIVALKAIKITADVFKEEIVEIYSSIEDACSELEGIAVRLKKQEDERAELVRLRAEAEARKAKEEKEREANEARAREEKLAKERKEAQDRENEADRIRLAELAERERIRLEKIQQEAADKAADVERKKAALEQAAKDKANAAKVAILEAEKNRLEKEAADKKAKEEKDKAEAEWRMKNEKHRKTIILEARKAVDATIIKASATFDLIVGLDHESIAYDIVQAIINNEIPHVKMEF